MTETDAGRPSHEHPKTTTSEDRSEERARTGARTSRGNERGAEVAVDAAQHPWTLDNPAYGWFGLSSAVRVRVGGGVRAVSVAEVVTATGTSAAPMARSLMVALVRAGVTATCSGADHPRYGDLAVDSNLPDARIAIGGLDQNVFTAAVLAEADAVYTEELKRQLDAGGTARVWVPPV